MSPTFGGDISIVTELGTLANLAYGVTTVLDPSTSSIDIAGIQDAVDRGLMVGSRIAQTGTANFFVQGIQFMPRFERCSVAISDDYWVGQSQMYRSGNRRVRQWIAMAARERPQPTNEGGLCSSEARHDPDHRTASSGNEHALTAVPAMPTKVVSLVATAGSSGTTTIQITTADGGAGTMSSCAITRG